METCVCPTCGAKMVEYKFGFNRGLAVALRALYRADGPVAMDSLGLAYAERTNSQKLAYWKLAVPVVKTKRIVSCMDPEEVVDELNARAERQRRAGWWSITEKGKDFVEGLITIPKYAHTLRGGVTGFSGDEMYIWDVKDGFEFRGDYVDQGRQCRRAWERFGSLAHELYAAPGGQ